MPIQPPPPSLAPQFYYVSTSGSNSNNGLSPSTPKQTLVAGKALMRPGIADQLLLKCGDTWTESFGEWTTSGTRATLPQVIGTYGTGARPIIQSGVVHGLYTTVEVNWLKIRNIDWYPHSFTGANGQPSGVYIGWKARGLTFEYNLFRNGMRGLTLDPTAAAANIIQEVKLYRNVVTDCYGTSGFSGHGIYAFKLFNSLFDENLILTIGRVSPSIGQHGIYMPQVGTYPNSYGNLSRNNLILDVSGCGSKVADGWDTGSSASTSNWWGNVFGKCSAGLWIGDCISANGGHDINLSGNVIVNGLDNGGVTGWCRGLCIENVTRLTSSQDLIVNAISGTAPHPIIIHPNYPTLNGRGCYGSVFNNLRVYGWPGTYLINGPLTAMGSNAIDNCYLNFSGSQACVEHVPDNTAAWHSAVDHILSAAASGNQFLVNTVAKSLIEWKALMHDTSSDAVLPTWPDPTRDVASYDLSIGGAGTVANFITECKLQSETNWRPQYTAQALVSYIRQGVGLT
jgi:hypothetical protein